MPSLLRGVGILSRNSNAYEDQSPFIIVSANYDDRKVTQPHRRFIYIHPFSLPLA